MEREEVKNVYRRPMLPGLAMHFAMSNNWMTAPSVWS